MIDVRTRYLNADFDLSLRPERGRLSRPAISRQVAELSLQAVFGCDPGDAALLRVAVPDDFVDYLSGCGLALPRLLEHPALLPESRFSPFGWSREAIELNGRHDEPVRHPTLEVIERVNSRSFARELEVELDPELPHGVTLDDRVALERFLARAAIGSEWIVKAEHGNSGLANRRLPPGKIAATDLRFVDEIYAEGDRLVIEPFLHRARDCSVVFETTESASPRIHETIYTRDGAMIGALFAPGGIDDRAWSEELHEMAVAVSKALGNAGYFGPVCVDSFLWRDGDRLRKRRLVDLNCRRSMSESAYRLWRNVAPERTLYYRFFNRRKLRAPVELEELAWDPERRTGILLGSPLSFSKIPVFLFARDREAVFELERRFRERFEG